jgi:hypothetical protein
MVADGWMLAHRGIDLVPNLNRKRRSNGRCVYDKAAKRELVRRCLLPGVSLGARGERRKR